MCFRWWALIAAGLIGAATLLAAQIWYWKRLYGNTWFAAMVNRGKYHKTHLREYP